jgi:hypothetical protein
LDSITDYFQTMEIVRVVRSWNRPDPSELLAYQVLFDAKTGGNRLSNSWMLAHMYIEPKEFLISATWSFAPWMFQFRTRLSVRRWESCSRVGTTQSCMTAGLRQRLFPLPVTAPTNLRPSPAI